ncbi:unnamed protein product [Paramecium pentaurelia]|uniref:Uncharacterized protein n=1 Tax=Paramecium pentaurelia TaxID=43138 RepID=A0A8S1VI01_9CILI|nr:unnamed protein product [Paramecium pentaurelia]
MNQQQQELRIIKLKIEKEVVQIDQRFANVSSFFQEIFEKEPDSDEIIEIPQSCVTQKAFDYIKKYYEYNKYEPQKIMGGALNADQLFLNQHDKELMLPVNPFNGDLLKQLIQAAVYFQLEAFKKLCLARLYYEFLIDPTDSKWLQKLAAKYPEVPPLSIAHLEQYKTLYPNLFKEFQ